MDGVNPTAQAGVSNEPAPSRAARLGFSLILGMCSTVFAEVTCSNDLYPFSHGWGLLIVVPLYTLHSLVLAGLVWRWGRPRWEALYLAGMLFGLYEAYLTKMIWNPTWDSAWKLGGISVLDTIVLVAFWHVLFAFIFPLLATESWLCRGNSVLAGMPGWLRRAVSPARAGKALPWIAVLLGLIHMGTEASLSESVLSLSVNAAIIACACLVWRTATGGRRYSLEQLLPTRREVLMLLVPLATLSVFLTVIARPEALPGAGPQLIVILIYIIVGGLLWLALRQSREAYLKPVPPPQWGWRGWAGLALLAVGLAWVGKATLGKLLHIELLLCWFGYIFVGLALMIAAVRTVVLRCLKRPKSDVAESLPPG